MIKDGGLRSLFRSKFPHFQWTSVETAGTASGVPDSEFCTPDGIQGWIEFKRTTAFYVVFQEFQPAWIYQRSRYGGNAWIAVRRIPTAKKFEGVDELWLVRGIQAKILAKEGLTDAVESIHWSGGPRNWNYAEIEEILNLRLKFK
jgi:hypothetical protein